jgi:4-amino-4-deoxy-L-arabinose transferase-like glycosyltransferase
VIRQGQQEWIKGLPKLGLIWLFVAIGDRLWFTLDHGIPAWDQADYLTGTLNYWQALQHPQWFSTEWWTRLWLLSSKIPPLTYLVTTPVFNCIGRGMDQATVINLGFSAILLGSVYSLGTCLFTAQVGLWAAGLCVLFPSLYGVRLDFLLDYPLTAMVMLSFCCLTIWRNTVQVERLARHPAWLPDRLPLPKLLLALLPSRSSSIWAIAFGISLGLAFLTKQTALFFLLIPMLWFAGEMLWWCAWNQIGLLLGAGLLSTVIWLPWYRINWLLMLTASKRAVVDSAIAEGDPPLNSLNAWIFYLKDLPQEISGLLLLVSLVGWLFYWRRSRILLWDSIAEALPQPKHYRQTLYRQMGRSLSWLAIFWVGAYLLCSLNINKDPRYVMPYLPIVAVFLAYGLLLLPGRGIRWGTVGVATLLMGLNLLPVQAWATPFLQNQRARHPFLSGQGFPHAQVIAEMIETEPFLRSTLGVLPSTAEINQHNLNFYGALRDFQVYGRQVGTRLSQVKQDTNALSWFVTKSGNQGSIRHPEALQAIVKQVEDEGNFILQRSWALPDFSQLKLFHRRVPWVEVEPLLGQPSLAQIKLDQITLAQQAPPGQPIAITYQWSGPWQQLRTGIVLLTWQAMERNQPSTPLASKPRTSRPFWLHDHGIGMGNLESGAANVEPSSTFQVIERTAMVPPATIAPGTYTLTATYLNRATGETYAIATPPIRLQITPTAPVVTAPDPDWVTQFRMAARALPQGITGLAALFDTIGRINQYDPIQDYLVQAKQSLSYRWQQDPQNREFAYAVALTEVLRRQINPAIGTLQRVIQLDAQNPNAYAYLAFVHLYAFHPQAAQAALKSALAIDPRSPELHLLSGVADLMQGHLPQAWQQVEAYQKLQKVRKKG